MEIFVTGGTGYVGQAIVQRLIRDGHGLRVLRRPGGRPLGTAKAVEISGDLGDAKALTRGMEGADAVVHLVGIIRERPGASFAGVHVEGTRAIVRAAQETGALRFLHMSALGADAGASTGYFRTKGEGEDVVTASPTRWTIFRPSVVFGEGGPGPSFLSTLRRDLLNLPLHPLFGRGDQRLQPVSVETVSEAFAHALTRPGAIGQVYPLVGPGVWTMREILSALAREDGRPFRPVSIPVGLMRVLIPVLERLPGFPLTSDQFAMLLEGNVHPDFEAVDEALGLTPIPLRFRGGDR